MLLKIIKKLKQESRGKKTSHSTQHADHNLHNSYDLVFLGYLQAMT